MMDRDAFDAMRAAVLDNGDYLADMLAHAPEVATIADGTVEQLLEVLADDLHAQAVALEFLEIIEPLLSD